LKLSIDTGSVAEEIPDWAVLSGATTKPSLLARGPYGRPLAR
jgi:hypothetical protein